MMRSQLLLEQWIPVKVLKMISPCTRSTWAPEERLARFIFSSSDKQHITWVCIGMVNIIQTTIAYNQSSYQ